MNIIETKGLVKHFNGVHAVDHLSIGFEQSKITGLIGPNGSGKTTLINLLSGIVEIDSGQVIVAKHKPFSRLRPYQASVCGLTRTFQNIRLFEQMTVLDNILVVLTERNVLRSLCEKPTETHQNIALQALQKVGLEEKKNELAANLSYGQRKLLEIARTLVASATIYLFDEPFAGLFPEMKSKVSGIIKKLREDKKTILLVEHDIGIIRELCDSVFVMDEGKVLAAGKPEFVLEEQAVIEAYLGG